LKTASEGRQAAKGFFSVCVIQPAGSIDKSPPQQPKAKGPRRVRTRSPSPVLSWNDLAGQSSLPPTSPAKRQRPFWFICAEVPNLLPLGLRGAAMILPSFGRCARLMRWSHVGKVILTSKLKSANVFNDPTLPYPIDLAIA
jgi:hypothetical protein